MTGWQRFEELPQDIQDDFRDAPDDWRVRALRSEGWTDAEIKEFLVLYFRQPESQEA